jgi:hypothetical protein
VLAMISSFKDSLFGEIHVAALEITEIPEAYLTNEVTDSGKVSSKDSFASVLRAMIVSGLPVGLRLERVDAKTRALFLTWTRDQTKLSSLLDSLRTTLNSHLPEFTLKRHERFSGLRASAQLQGITACLVGAPEVAAATNATLEGLSPMDAAGEALLLANNALLQVFVTPIKYSSGRLRSLESDYESALQGSQRTVTSHGGFSASQESRVRVNAEATREAERLQRHLVRLRSRYLGEVSVCITLWGQDRKETELEARRLASVLVGGITPADPDEDIQIVLKKSRRDLERVLSGRPLEEATILTPEEASVYFSLPRCDLDIRVFRSSSFASPGSSIRRQPEVRPVPQPHTQQTPSSAGFFTSASSVPSSTDPVWTHRLPELILLGQVLRNRVPQPQKPYGIVRWVLGRHIGLFGNSGTGKTTTAISIVAQAYRNGVIPTVLVPGNAKDWRVLKDLYDEFRIFTAGNPDIAPLRYNMWDVPPGVSVSRYIDRMVDTYIAAQPTDGVIAMHLRDVFETMYENCGWSRLSNVRGRPILLTDLYEAMGDVTLGHLKYGEDLRRDFYGALEARVRSMLRNGILVDMFNTTAGLSIPDLLAHPTIIEMRDLSPEDMALLTGALTVGINEYMTANPASQVEQLLVLEESHHLLRRLRGPTAYAEPTSRQKAIDNIVGMLREQRKNGLGIMLIDQLPSSMTEEAVKLPSSVIIHALTDPEERLLVGGQASCRPDQIAHLGSMAVGEAVVKVPKFDLPANIQVVPLTGLVRTRLPRRDWSDAAVREAMAPVFDEYPELRERHGLSEEMRDLLRGKSPVPQAIEAVPRLKMVRVSQQPEADISEIVGSPRFAQEYVARADLASEGDPVPVARLLLTVAGKFSAPEESPIPFAERLLLHAAGILQHPTETTVLTDILVAIRGSTA